MGHGSSWLARVWCLCRRLVFPLSGAVLVLAMGAAPSFAWTVEQTDHGTAIVRRESTDATAAIAVLVAYDYKGNKSLGYWDSAYPPANAGSYNSTWNMGTVSGAAPCDSVEVPLNVEYVQQAVRVVQGGNYYTFPVWYREASTNASVTALPSVLATVTALPAVALESSISVDGTLPVNVADLPAGAWALVGLGAVLLGVVFTSVAVQGVRRAR